MPNPGVVDRAAALKCNGSWVEIFPGSLFIQRQCTLEGVAWYVSVLCSVQWECNFFNLLSKLTDEKQHKVGCLVHD